MGQLAWELFMSSLIKIELEQIQIVFLTNKIISINHQY
ncbi:MAG: hypothetical protein ACI93N_001181 [Flavobacteriaceae bacterium]|jgi:hypothetical protein